MNCLNYIWSTFIFVQNLLKNLKYMKNREGEVILLISEKVKFEYSIY